ncbi:hypothetical protein D3C81_1369650 [compost metagenome]
MVCPDRIAGDRHAFHHGVRVALQDRAVHERAWIAFVGVANHIFLPRPLLRRRLPLDPGREPAAAAPAEACFLHLGHDLRRIHGRQNFMKRLVPIHGDIFVDILRIDRAAVAQSDPLLLAEEVDFMQRLDSPILQRLLIDEVFDNFALKQVLIDDLRHVLHLHPAVEHLLRVNDHDRPQLA